MIFWYINLAFWTAVCNSFKLYPANNANAISSESLVLMLNGPPEITPEMSLLPADNLEIPEAKLVHFSESEKPS